MKKFTLFPYPFFWGIPVLIYITLHNTWFLSHKAGSFVAADKDLEIAIDYITTSCDF